MLSGPSFAHLVAESVALERHFTPQEIADIWRLDVSTIIRIFKDSPGVLKIGREGRRDGKRDYTSLRIPASVVQRVHAKRVNGGRR